MQIGWSRVGVNIHVGQCTTPVCAPTRTAALSLELRPVVAADGARAGDDGAVASRGGIAAALALLLFGPEMAVKVDLISEYN